MLTVNVYIIVIYDVITVDYCKCILLYDGWVSSQFTHLNALVHVVSLWPVSEHLAQTSLCLHLLVTWPNLRHL